MVKKHNRIEWQIRTTHSCGHETINIIANAAHIKGGYSFAQVQEIDRAGRERLCGRCQNDALMRGEFHLLPPV